MISPKEANYSSDQSLQVRNQEDFSRKQGVLFVLMQKQPPKIDSAENCDDHILEIPNKAKNDPIVIAEQEDADAGNSSEDKGQLEAKNDNGFEIKVVVVQDASQTVKVEGRNEDSPNKLIAASIENDAKQEQIVINEPIAA